MKNKYLIPFAIFIFIGTSAFAQPANNDCANAIPVSFGTDQSFSTIDATTDGPEHVSASCFAFGNDFCNKEVWYSITADNDGSIEFSTCSSAPFDTRIVAYNPGASCPPVDSDLLACNDDGPACDNFTSKIDFPVTAGETYLLCLGGYEVDETGEGTFSLIEIATPIAPDNNDCSASEELMIITPEQAADDEGWVEGNNENAPAVVGGLSCLPIGEFYDVWYHFNSGSEDLLTVIFEKLDVEADFHIEIWENDCSSQTLSMDDGGVITQVCWDQNETTAGILTLDNLASAPGSYKIRVTTQITNYTPGGFQLQLVAGEPIGISEFNDNRIDLNIYPNPNNGNFILNIEKRMNNANINITDLQGRIVYNESMSVIADQNIDMNLEFLNPGIYLMNVMDENDKTIGVKKVIIE